MDVPVKSKNMSNYLLPSTLRIQLPSIATRRFVRCQQKLRIRPQHPLEESRPEPRGSYPCCFLGGRRQPEFEFIAPDCRLVTFARPDLLPRVLEFEPPPHYG